MKDLMLKYYSVAFRTLAVVALLFILPSCIKNDIPFPRIPQCITAIAVQDQIAPADIDNEKYTATVYLDEKTDIRKVLVTDFQVTEDAEVSPDLEGQTVDFSKPVPVMVSGYQSYQWIVSAVQNIERYFTVQGQIGETELDAIGHRIIVTLPESADRSAVKINSIKLGPADITSLSPEVAPGSSIDLSKPFRIDVTCHGKTDQWSIYSKVSHDIVTTSEVTAWSQVIWAVANAPEDADNGFRYRKASDTEWITVPKENITFSQGTFTACIPHLTPLTQYVVQAYSDTNFDAEVSVTTQSTEILPDGSFDQWWQNGRIWCPWNENGVKFWDTGNTGAATLGQSNSVPSDHTPDGTGMAARLDTKFVGIAGIGKLAAGNIFTGNFIRVDGTNGILDFGRPWNVRPTKLAGFFEYTTAPINYVSSEYEYLRGRPDSCHIYIAVTDWTAPYQIRTNPKNRQLFDRNSPSVIAYGELVCGENTGGYKPFEIVLKYRSYSRVPSYIQITCSASKYGDFFTGGAGATLYVDQLSLHYDY